MKLNCKTIQQILPENTAKELLYGKGDKNVGFLS